MPIKPHSGIIWLFLTWLTTAANTSSYPRTKIKITNHLTHFTLRTYISTKTWDCFTYLSHNYSFQLSFLRVIPTKYCCTSYNPNKTNRLCHMTTSITKTCALAVFILHVTRQLHGSQLLWHIQLADFGSGS